MPILIQHQSFGLKSSVRDINFNHQLHKSSSAV